MAGRSTDDQLDVLVAPIQRPSCDYYAISTTWQYRLHVVSKMRTDPSRVASPPWCAVELLYHALAQDVDLADAVIIIAIVGGLSGDTIADAAIPLPGRRILRLLFEWSAIEPSLSLPPRRLSADVLAKMVKPGGVLRARVRQTRRASAALTG